MWRSVVSALLLAACSVGAAPADPPSRVRRQAEAQPQPELSYVEWVSPAAEGRQALPLVVAVHGLGDTPENFIRGFADPGQVVRVVAPRAPLQWRRGWSWFNHRVAAADPEVLSDELQQRADEVAALIEHLKAQGKVKGPVLVTGFSQGGMVSFAMALHRPDAIDGALPLSGHVPAPLLARTAAQTGRVPVRAFHGDEDPVLPVTNVQHAVQVMQERGYDAGLTVFPGMGHTISSQAREAFRADLETFLTTP